jgi:hypothetical protein
VITTIRLCGLRRPLYLLAWTLTREATRTREFCWIRRILKEIAINNHAYPEDPGRAACHWIYRRQTHCRDSPKKIQVKKIYIYVISGLVFLMHMNPLKKMVEHL